MIKSRILMYLPFLGLTLIFLIAMTPVLSLAQLGPGPFEVESLVVSDITISDDVAFDGGTFYCTGGGEEPYEKPGNNSAIIYYPATNDGAVVSDRFPLIVYGHGMRARCHTCAGSPDDNWNDFQRLSVIFRHLASWGFIIISPDLSWLTPALARVIEDRMVLLGDAVSYMLTENARVGSPFENRVRPTCIGAMGHSMGADAAILLGTSGEMGENISVIAPIAPPNHGEYGSDYIGDFAPRPVMLLQGTKDAWYCFPFGSKAEAIYAAYDTAEQTKHLVTIEGANHFGYTDDICTNDDDNCSGDFLLLRDDQQSIAKAYLTAFFRRYLSPGCVTELNVYLDGSQEFEGLEGFDIGVLHVVTDEAICLCRQLPICNAAGPYIAECSGATTPILLDGSGSTNPDPEDPLTYFWSTDCPGGNFDDPSSATPQFYLVFDTCPTECTVFLTVTDSSGLADSCSAPVTVFDEAKPEIDCNAPTTITPPDAPISFASTATDNCASSLNVEITGYDCFKYTKKGKRVDKTESCVVKVEGDTVTILDSGGVGDHISWTILATDNCGNETEEECEVEVVKKGKP